MRALVFHGPWEMTVEDRPEPAPGPHDTLLQIIATGICGSDLHGYTGETGRRQPGQVMGHETVGRVLEDRTGAHRPGRLVTVNPVLGCGHCPACAVGARQRCPDRRVIGVQADISAAFAERMVAPTHNIVALPEGTPPEVGGLVEPLAVGYHAIRRGGMGGDDIPYVLGGGPIGQAVAIAARRLGATTVVVAELDANRRGLLERVGFTTVDPAAQLAEAIVGVLGGPPSVVVDAVGATGTLQGALDIAAPGARIVLVGMATPRIELAAYAVSTGERSIIGSFAYDDAAFRDTAGWAAAHAAELTPLIEARVGLDEAPGAFRSLAAGELTAGKILVYPSGQPEPAAGAPRPAGQKESRRR
jgi:threonine dehydrogenase-like Zn-dependent dehydrogenase